METSLSPFLFLLVQVLLFYYEVEEDEDNGPKRVVKFSILS